MEKPHIRPFRDEDAEATAKVFFHAIHEGAKNHYDAAQRAAWAPEIPASDIWRARLAPQTVLVAELDEEIVGFMSLTDAGHIDLAFVVPAAMGRGIADALYETIREKAAALNLRQLTTDASHQARRFFERQGWQITAEQNVVRNGMALTNYRMKTLIS